MSLLVVRAKFGGGTTIIPLVVAFLEISKTFVETTTYLRRKLSLVSIIVLGRVTCYHILLVLRTLFLCEPKGSQTPALHHRCSPEDGEEQ